MLDDVKEKVEVEILNLENILREYGPLLLLIKNKTPDLVETAAMATVLHSFYNGVENTFKIILKGCNEKLPDSKEWHIELLNISIKPCENRPAIISMDLQEKLVEYMKFRHTFRHMYAYQLKWAKMENLALNIENIIKQFVFEIRLFIRS